MDPVVEIKVEACKPVDLPWDTPWLAPLCTSILDSAKDRLGAVDYAWKTLRSSVLVFTVS